MHHGYHAEEGSIALVVSPCFINACDGLQLPIVTLAWHYQFDVFVFDALVADRFFTDQAPFKGPWVMWVVVSTCHTAVFWYLIFTALQALAILIWNPVCWAAQALFDTETWDEQWVSLLITCLK
jgi:hypothetical protein